MGHSPILLLMIESATPAPEMHSPNKASSSNYSTRVSRFSSFKQLPYDSSLLREIQQKYEGRIVDQEGLRIPTHAQLYKSTKEQDPEEYRFKFIPPPSPYSDKTSKIAKRILMDRESNTARKGYPKSKRNLHIRDQFPTDQQQRQLSESKLSKTQRSHKKQYSEVFTQVCATDANRKPKQDKVYTPRFLFTQICPSGLATHQFHSVNAKRRITLMNTQMPESESYPFSPRTQRNLSQTRRKVNASSSRVSKIQKHKNKEVEDLTGQLINQQQLSTDQFIREYTCMRAKKTKIYGQKAQQLDEALKFMRGDEKNATDALDMIDLMTK